jgi:predicted DNA-binding WGR domain protein
MRRFELVDGTSKKFWEVRQDGVELHIGWGKIGTAGQSQVKTFDDVAAATAAAEKLIKEKTKKGYGEVGSDGGDASEVVGEPRVEGVVWLSYQIADFDAEDEVAFEVSAGSGGLEARWSEGSESADAAALDGATKIWVLSQLSPSPEDREGWTPPFVVSHAVRDALVRDGEVTLHTGFAPEQTVVLARVEKDAMSEETAEAVSKWKGKILCASNDEGDELVIANAATPQLLAFRTNDVCTVTWLSGVLVGAKDKAPKPPKKAKPKGKRESSAEVLASAEASKADRVKAAKALGKAAKGGSAAALTALAAHLTEPDQAVGAEVRTQLTSACWARRHAGEPYDVLPLVKGIVASSPEQAIPDASVGDFDPVSGALSATITFLQDDPREEALAVLRDLAWHSMRGGASSVARMLLANRGDAEAIERVSNMLADSRMNTTAARALAGLPADVAIPRAQAQLETLEGQARLGAAQMLFNAVETPPAAIDCPAWFAFLKGELSAGGPSYLGDRFEMWVGKNLAHMGPPSEELALLCAKEFRVWRDHDLAKKLAAFPKSALSSRVVREALSMSGSFDVSPVLGAADDDVIVEALTGAMEDETWACSLEACLTLAARKSAALRPPLEALAQRFEAWEDEGARRFELRSDGSGGTRWCGRTGSW